MLGQKVTLIAVIVLFLLAALSGGVILAQDDTGACPALVTSVLQTAGDLCGGLNRNEACYGYNRVDALFWQEQAADVFSAPADRVSLLDLRQLTTSPLSLDESLWGVAVLHVQADVPDTLPGQAVTFVLLGDASLENAVSPEDAAEAVSVTVTTAVAANVRSRPSTVANVLVSFPAGSELILVGVNAAGTWYEVALDGNGHGWIAAELVAAEDADLLAALPITAEGAAPHYGPMQAFYFTAGLDEPACAEAPNALVVQSPNDVAVTLNINGLDIEIGSTVIFTLAEVTPDGAAAPQRALVAALVRGHLQTEVNGAALALTQRGSVFAPSLPAFAVTLNAVGLVDADSVVVPLPPGAVAMAVEYACAAGVESGLLGELRARLCGVAVSFVEPLPPVNESASAPADEGAGEPVSEVPAESQAPQESSSSGGGSSGGGASTLHFYWGQNRCEIPGNPGAALLLSNPVTFVWGIGCFESAESAAAHPNPASYAITVDGAPLDMGGLQVSGPDVHAPDCPWGWSYTLPNRTLPAGDHQLNITQVVTTSWQDSAGGIEAGTTFSMACTVSVQ